MMRAPRVLPSSPSHPEERGFLFFTHRISCIQKIVLPPRLQSRLCDIIRNTVQLLTTHAIGTEMKQRKFAGGTLH